MSATIRINGVAGSNPDLPLNTPVALTNATAEGSYLWSIVDQPDGAADALSGTTSPSVTFTPRKEGTYLLRLEVNGDPAQSNQVIAAVRQLKTRIRIPAGSETTEAASAPRGWATDANTVLGLVDTTRADPGILVGQADAALARGDVVRLSGSATIKSGLPGQEVLPVWTKAAADTAGNVRGLLGIVEGAVDGGSIISGTLMNVRTRGLFQGASVAGSPAVGSVVFLADSVGTMSTAAGTVRRVFARIVSGSGPWNLAVDGAGLYDDAVAVGTFVPTTRTLQGTSPIAIAGGYAAVDLSANRVISLAISGEQDEDVIVRKAGAWTRLAKGANGTYLGVTAGVVGYSAPSGTIYSAGAGLTLTGNTFAADFGTSAGEVLEGSNDALYVKLAGAQTVTGAKTFAADVTLGTGARIIEDTGSGLVTVYEYLSGQHELGTTGVPLRLSGGATLALRNATNNRLELTSTGVDILTGSTRKFTLTSGVHIGISNISRVSGEVSAQTRFIVGTGAANASASFEMQSTTTGWLGPRLTTTQRDAISSPATSLVIFNTTNARFEWYSGSAWLPWGSWLGGEPFYFAGPAGSGPGGSNPQYATLTAMMNAMVADGATALAPRVGFFTGTITENPTLRAGTFIVGLGASRRANTIVGRVDYQPSSSPNTPIAGLAHCRVVQASAAVDAVYARPAADAELWLDDVESDCAATSASYASLHVDGSLGGLVVVRATRCALTTPGGSSAKALRVVSAGVYYDGHIITGASGSAQADAIYASSATVVFNPVLDGLDADKHLGGRVYLTGTGSVVTLGANTRHETAALSGSNPPVTIDGAQTVNLGANVRVKAGANTTKHIEKTGAGTGTVNVQGPVIYADTTSAALQIDTGITYNGETTTQPERVQLITTTATIAKDTTLAIVIPGSGSTFTVTMPNPTGFQPDRRLRVKYTGPTNKQNLSLAAHTSGGTDYDTAKNTITFKWNDAYDFAPQSSVWLILGQYNANPSGGGGGSPRYTYVPLVKGGFFTVGISSIFVGGGSFKTAEHDLTGGRTIKLRAQMWAEDPSVDSQLTLYDDTGALIATLNTSSGVAPTEVLSADLSSSFGSDKNLIAYLVDANSTVFKANIVSAELVVGP